MQLDYTKAGNAKIESLGIMELDVYDLEVEKNHTFFANDILVHNTDSIYLNVQPIIDTFCPEKNTEQTVTFLDKFGETICKDVVDKSITSVFEEMNCFNKVMDSKREAISSKILFRSKKNYAMMVHNSEGVSFTKPKLKVKGIEIVRSSTPQWCRKKLKDSLQSIFETNELSFREKFLLDEKEFNSLAPHEIAFPRGVSDVDKWSNNGKPTPGTPIAVRATLVYNEAVKKFNTYPQIQNGDKIKFVYLKMPNPLKQNVIGFPSNMQMPKELGLEKYVDYKTQFEKTFESPLTSLTSCAGWNIRKQSTLVDFFETE